MAYDLHMSTEPDDQAYVRDKLIAYNRTRMGGEPPYKRFTILARGGSARPIGGISCTIGWDWLYIDLLWVDEDHRGSGVGTDLMERAEREALEVGVTRAHTTTTSFQARPFYEKRGYELFGTLEDKPLGHILFFLKNGDLTAHG